MTANKTIIEFGMSMHLYKVLSYVTCIFMILNMCSKKEILHHLLYFSAASVGRHLPALHAQIGESGVLVGGNNCQPSVDHMDVYELFQGTAKYHYKAFVQLIKIVVRVQLLH